MLPLQRNCSTAELAYIDTRVEEPEIAKGRAVASDSQAVHPGCSARPQVSQLRRRHQY